LVIDEEQRILRQMLCVADNGEAAADLRHHERILPAMRRADPIVTPVF